MTLRTTSFTNTSSEVVTLLILGAGWTYQFLHAQLEKDKFITYAATTTTGHDDTIPFRFDPDSDDLAPFQSLPHARYVLVTFPLKGKGPSRKLVGMYEKAHPLSVARTSDDLFTNETKWIQLGSTGVYTASDWADNSSPIDPSSERGSAEDEFISLGGCVLNLAGLYGAERQPGNWISRVAKTKEQLGSKGALHLIHGTDVARAIIEVIRFDGTRQGLEIPNAVRGTIDSDSLYPNVFRKRWIICDCVSYDWWKLVWDFNGETQEGVFWPREGLPGEVLSKIVYRAWVLDLMKEKGVRALPRSVELLGRKLDGREFWQTVGIRPERTLKM